MTGYRLTIGVQHLRSNGIVDSIIAADDTVGEIVSSLGEGVEFLSHNYLIGLVSSQIVVRFAAPDDSAAYEAANGALRSVSLPIDGGKIERRSSTYVTIGGAS